MGYPDHGNGSVNERHTMPLSQPWSAATPLPSPHALAVQLARIETNQQELIARMARYEEQQDKDSAMLTEISMVLNELLPYARRAVAMMDGNPLSKLRAAFGKDYGVRDQ